MIRRIGIFSLLFLLLFSCSRQKRAIIHGKIKNAAGQTVYIEELRLRKNRILDSCQLKNSGKLRFNLDIKIPGYYQMRFTDGQTISLILSPGERFKIFSDFNRFYESKLLEGSQNTLRVNRLHDSLRIVIEQAKDIRKSYTEIAEEEDPSPQTLDSINQVYNNLRDEYKKFTMSFILEDLRSLANIAALYQQYDEGDFVFYSNRDLQFFKLVSDTLHKYYPRVKYVKILKENYESFFNDYQHARLMQMATPTETIVPNLTLPDPKGVDQSLEKLKGKVVLLSFWSVNQSESVQKVLEMQKTYKKYKHKGFEIYQVSIDKSLSDWRKAVKFEEIPWISVCDTAFPNSNTRLLYNVNEIPLNYLIDSEQSEVLARNLTANELDQTLNTLLNQN
jgi:hypothetical protein